MAKLQALEVTARGVRGMVKPSITNLTTHVSELEKKPELLHFDQLAAKRLQERFTGLDHKFKSYQLSIIALLEEEEELDTEQAVLDGHGDRVTGLLLNCLMILITLVKQYDEAIKQYDKAIKQYDEAIKQYDEAIKGLQNWSDIPCISHQAQVRVIVEVPGPKEGTNKELLRFMTSAANICGH